MFPLCKLHVVHFPLRIERRFVLMMRTLLYLLANIYMANTTKKAQPALRVPSKLLIYINWLPPKSALSQYHWCKLLYSSKFRNLFQLFVCLAMLQSRNRNLAIIWISFHNLYIPAQIVTTKKSITNSWPVELDCSTDNIYHELFAKSYEIS